MRFVLLLAIGGSVWAQTPAAPAKPKTPAAVKPARPAAKQAVAKPAAVPAAAPAEPVVFSAGLMKMTKSEFDTLVKNLPESLRTQLAVETPQGRRRFAEQLGEIAQYASEAKKRGLDSTPTAKAQALLQQQNLMASLLYQHLLETSKPTEAASRAWFDANKGNYEQAKARHILVRFKGSPVPAKPNQQELSEDDALARSKAIRERVVKGEDFAAVAKAESDDAGSGAQGGDLGSFGHGRMVPVFEQAAFSLPIGEVSQPVKSQFGWHLIQVQSRTAKEFAEVRAEIDKRLQTESAQKAMQGVKTSGKTTLDETYFGPAPAPAPAPPTPQPAPPAKQ